MGCTTCCVPGWTRTSRGRNKLCSPNDVPRSAKQALCLTCALRSSGSWLSADLPAATGQQTSFVTTRFCRSLTWLPPFAKRRPWVSLGSRKAISHEYNQAKHQPSSRTRGSFGDDAASRPVRGPTTTKGAGAWEVTACAMSHRDAGRSSLERGARRWTARARPARSVIASLSYSFLGCASSALPSRGAAMRGPVVGGKARRRSS